MAEAIQIARRQVDDPGSVIRDYIDSHDGTVTHFDLLPAESRNLRMPLVKATRSPWMSSRISSAEAAWFIERGESAPWDSVPTDADLGDADPTERGGLYDGGTELYAHFYERSPKGIAHAKVSKVLHLMRPHLVPILDSRLLRLYGPAARDTARQLREARPEVRYSRAYWAAIRSDLLGARVALRQVRADLASSEKPLHRRVAAEVSDLRLLDMVTWKI